MAADLISMVTGGVIGLVSGLVSNYALEQYKTNKTARHLAQSFVGEIKALKTITGARGYKDGLKKIVEYMESTGHPRLYQVQVRKDYFLVYKQNADKIGMLEEPLPEYLAIFYTLSNSILEDLQSLNDGTFANSSSEHLIKCYKDLLTLFEEVENYSEMIINVVSEKYVEPI